MEKKNCINDLFSWNFLVFINGTIVEEKVLEISSPFGNKDFPDNNGFIDRLQKRHNLTCNLLCGESPSSIYSVTIQEWK